MKVNYSDWKDFLIGDLFECTNTGNILSREIEDGSGNTPFVTSSGVNNGVVAYIDASKYDIIPGHCILIGGKTFTLTYQKDGFVSNDSHNIVIRLKNNEVSSLVYLFLVSAIRASLSKKYEWSDAVTKEKLLSNTIKLPEKDGVPDWDYMDSYIKQVKERASGNLKLLVSAIYTEGGGTLNESWKPFVVGKLFPSIIKPTVYHSHELEEDINGIPYVVRSKFNNGIKCRVKKLETISISPAGVISFGAENASFFYQPEEWCSGRDIYYIDTRHISKNACLFVASCLQKVTSKYGYNYGLFPDLLKCETIQLPVDSLGAPNWTQMESFIDRISDRAKNLMKNLS